MIETQKSGEIVIIHFHEIFRHRKSKQRDMFEQRIYLVSINLTSSKYSSTRLRSSSSVTSFVVFSFLQCSSCSGGTFLEKNVCTVLLLLFDLNEKFWRVNLDKT